MPEQLEITRSGQTLPRTVAFIRCGSPVPRLVRVAPGFSPALAAKRDATSRPDPSASLRRKRAVLQQRLAGMGGDGGASFVAQADHDPRWVPSGSVRKPTAGRNGTPRQPQSESCLVCGLLGHSFEEAGR